MKFDSKKFKDSIIGCMSIYSIVVAIYSCNLKMPCYDLASKNLVSITTPQRSFTKRMFLFNVEKYPSIHIGDDRYVLLNKDTNIYELNKVDLTKAIFDVRDSLGNSLKWDNVLGKRLEEIIAQK